MKPKPFSFPARQNLSSKFKFANCLNHTMAFLAFLPSSVTVERVLRYHLLRITSPLSAIPSPAGIPSSAARRTRTSGISIATEHAAKSYAAQTAKLLHADAHILSYSGFGVYSGFPEESCKNETDLLPLVYEAAGFYHYQPENWKSTILLPFAPPEAVILYLGTNDSAYLHLFPEEGAAFQAAYAAFLQKLRSQFPMAFLVCMIGMSSDLDAAPFIRNAVAAAQQQDSRLALCEHLPF